MQKCIRCCGTGKYLGNGFIMTTCTLCDEDGFMIPIDKENLNESKPQIKLDRRSESYRKAIKDIMVASPTLTRQEAIKLFDEAYSKGE
jgi:hypothetical protein